MRPEIRQAAQAYYAQAGGPSSEFTAFEKRFLHCRMGFAGAADPWMAAAAKASANPAPFVASWRAFVREELHHYLAEQTVPPGPRDAGWATYDAKPAWDEMLARTKEWLEQGKIAATPAAVPRPQPQTSSPPKVAPQQGEQIGSKMKSILDQLGGR
jgi:hypothetical protein